MSIRFNAHADRLFRTTGIPSSLNWTAAGFFQMVNNLGAKSTLVSLEENAFSFQQLTTKNDGAALLAVAGDTPPVELSAGLGFVPGTWYFVAIIHTTTEIKIWVVEVGSSSFIAASVADDTARSMDLLVLMGSSFTEPVDGRATGWRIWDASDLSDGDLLAESQSMYPVRTADLNAFYRWLDTDELLTDHGPNGYHLSQVGGGAWETEEGPPGIPAFLIVDLASTIEGPSSSMVAAVETRAQLASIIGGPTSSMAGLVRPPGAPTATLAVEPGPSATLRIL